MKIIEYIYIIISILFLICDLLNTSRPSRLSGEHKKAAASAEDVPSPLQSAAAASELVNHFHSCLFHRGEDIMASW